MSYDEEAERRREERIRLITPWVYGGIVMSPFIGWAITRLF